MVANIPQRVSELLCSRLCHDLISPTAAISNGLELLSDEIGGIDESVMSLLTFSAGQSLATYRIPMSRTDPASGHRNRFESEHLPTRSGKFSIP